MVTTSRAAMPHLRSARGRLSTVSSVRGVLGQPFTEAYSAAKFAVEGFMEALAPVAASVGVTAWVSSGAVEGAQTSAEVAEVIVHTLTCDDPPCASRKLKDPTGRDLLATTRGWVTPSEPALR